MMDEVLAKPALLALLTPPELAQLRLRISNYCPVTNRFLDVDAGAPPASPMALSPAVEAHLCREMGLAPGARRGA